MKKCSSVVWRFFDRIENENQRCYAVLCKLCDTQYKFFGNTTNLRAHLINKHPLQWELSQNGTFDESNFRLEDDESNQSTAATSKRRKYNKTYKDKNVRYSVSVDNARNSSGGRIPKIEIQRVDILESGELDNEHNENEENEATYNLVRQLHESRATDEEWLDEEQYSSDIYEPKRKRMYRKIKREVQTPPRRTSTYKPTVKYEKSPILIDQYSVKDEYSVFGEYVANKLRKFKVPRTRGNLQQLITTILWQAEYGTYDSADAVKRVLMYTVQEPDQPNEMETQHVQSEEIVEQMDEEANQSMESENVIIND